MSTTILRRLRLERGLSQREAAALIGIGHVTLHNLERGISHGRPRTRAALTRFFGIPVDVLLMPDPTKNAAALADDGAVSSTTNEIAR